MNTFPTVLMVIFFNNGKEIIIPKENNLKYTKLDDAGRIYIDLEKEPERKILDILLNVDLITLEGKDRRITERQFTIDATTLFISVEDVEK